MFVTVTITPGREAPLLSRTVPSMLPFAACACAAAVCGDTRASATQNCYPESSQHDVVPSGQRKLPDPIDGLRSDSPSHSLASPNPAPPVLSSARSLLCRPRQQGACDHRSQGQARSIQCVFRITSIRSELVQVLRRHDEQGRSSHEQRRSSRYLRWAVGCLLAWCPFRNRRVPRRDDDPSPHTGAQGQAREETGRPRSPQAGLEVLRDCRASQARSSSCRRSWATTTSCSPG